MTTRQHLLAIVEPTPDHDATLDLARSVVDQGGQASVVVMITNRVRRDIGAFARQADLGLGDATEMAIDRLTGACERQVGSPTAVSIAHTPVLGPEVHRYVTPDTTTIAIPSQLASGRTVRRLTSATGLPVLVAPRRGPGPGV